MPRQMPLAAQHLQPKRVALDHMQTTLDAKLLHLKAASPFGARRSAETGNNGTVGARFGLPETGHSVATTMNANVCGKLAGVIVTALSQAQESEQA